MGQVDPGGMFLMSSRVSKNISCPENLSGRFQPAAVMRSIQGRSGAGVGVGGEAETPGKSS